MFWVEISWMLGQHKRGSCVSQKAYWKSKGVVVCCTFELAPKEHQLQEGYRAFDPKSKALWPANRLCSSLLLMPEIDRKNRTMRPLVERYQTKISTNSDRSIRREERQTLRCSVRRNLSLIHI